MQSLFDAIETKLLDSALYNQVGGRCYQEEADSNEYPYVVYSVVSTNPTDLTFTEDYENTLVQFDLFSTSSAGKAQIRTMYANLKALFSTTLSDGRVIKECQLPITGSTMLWMRWQSMVPLFEGSAEPLPDGSSGISHYAVDYEVYCQDN